MKRLKWNRWCFKFIPPTGGNSCDIKVCLIEQLNRIRKNATIASSTHMCKRIIFITFSMPHHKKILLNKDWSETNFLSLKECLQRNLRNQKMSFELFYISSKWYFLICGFRLCRRVLSSSNRCAQFLSSHKILYFRSLSHLNFYHVFHFME